MIRLADPPDDHDFYRFLLFQELPNEFFRRLFGRLDQSYKAAHAYVYENYQDPEAHDLLGHDRRARAEEVFRVTACEFGFACTANKNATRNYHHRALRSGRLIVTQHYSDSRSVRPAGYRDELAQLSCVGALLGDPMLDELIPQGRTIYAMLVHGAHPGDRRKLGYVEAFFPDADQDRYSTKIDLLKLFSLPVSPARPEEAVPAETDMRPRRQEKDGSA